MTTTDDLFPSKYLKASDVANEPIVTIKSVTKEKLKNKDTGQEDFKPIIYFSEFEKGVVLNKTNSNTISALYGNVIEEWVGRRIQLCSAMVEAFGERQPAIRVKDTKPPVDKKVLMEHYQALWERGKKAKMKGIEDYVISPDMPEQEITDLGKELKAKVEAAEAF